LAAADKPYQLKGKSKGKGSGRKGTGVGPAAPFVSSTDNYAMPDWQLSTGSTPPSLDSNASVTYNPEQNFMIVFGGKKTTGLASNETWTFDGSAWQQRTTTGTPTARLGAALFWDPALHRAVMFGGANVLGTSNNETWELNTSTWAWTNKTSVVTGTPPSARRFASAAYNTAAGVGVLSGGLGASSTVYRDSFSWNNYVWTNLNDTALGYRWGAAAAYDPSAQSITVFGGRKATCSTCSSTASHNNETWTWKTASPGWTQQTPHSAPSGRSFATMAFDSDAGQLVLVGGGDATSTHGDTFRYDGTSWYEPTGGWADGTAAAMSPIASPDGQSGAVMAYLPVVHSMVLLGQHVTSATAPATYVANHGAPTVSDSEQSRSPSMGSTAPAGTGSRHLVTIGNPSSVPMVITGVTDTLPVNHTASVWFPETSVTTAPTACTSTTTPRCTVGRSGVTFSNFTLTGQESRQFYVDAVAVGAALSSLAYGPCTSNADFFSRTVIDDGALSYWRLGEYPTPPNTSPVSAAKNAVNPTGPAGTYTLATGAAQGQPGVIGGDADRSLLLNGTSDYVSLPTTGSSDFSNGFTMEAWVKPTKTSSPILSLSSALGTDHIVINDFGTHGMALNVYAGTAGNTQSTLVAGNALQLDQWQHVAATVAPVAGTANATATLYRNGMRVASGTLLAPRDVSRVYNYLGRNNTSYFGGGMDDVAIYGKALSGAQITTHYHAGSTSGQGSNTVTAFTNVGAQYAPGVMNVSPAAYWRLDDSSGTDAGDYSGNNKKGTYLTSGGTASSSGMLNGPGALAGDPDASAAFDGSHHVRLPDSIIPTTGFAAVSLWFQTTAGNGVLASMANTVTTATPSRYVPLLYVGTDNKLHGGFWTGASAEALTGGATVTDGKWHHAMIVSYSSSTPVPGVHLYMDGQEVASTTEGPTDEPAGTIQYLGTGFGGAVGTWPGLTTGWHPFVGGIDDAAVFTAPDRFLSQTPSDQYARGAGLPVPASTTAYVTDGQGQIPALTPLCGGGGTAAGLGIEKWWSYASENLGAGGTARVNVANGNLVVSQPDLTPVQAHGHLAFALRRTYNSQDAGTLQLPDSVTGGAGWGSGWTLNMTEADDLLGGGINASSLSVQQTLERLQRPFAVTLADQDGTRHVFQPAVVLANRRSPLGALVPRLLGAVDSNVLCVDVPYTAPAGVHLSLFRYVHVQGSCATGEVKGIAGWVAERPDRLRYEFGPTGELLSIADGAGVDIRYAYDGTLNPARMVDSKSGGLGKLFSYPVAGLADRLSLGRLRYVYEGQNCTAVRNSETGAISLEGKTGNPASGCRGFTLSYNENGGTCATSGTATTWTCITDGAGRATRYEFNDSSRQRLDKVINPNGVSTLVYEYGEACGQTVNCLSSASDLRAGEGTVTNPDGSTDTHVTEFAYAAAPSPAWTGGGLPTSPYVVSRITDRHKVRTELRYNGGQYTNVDTAATPNVTCASDDATCERQQYSGIDSAGRVGRFSEAAGNITGIGSNSAWLRSTAYSWDTDSATCREPTHTRDNNLCRVVRDAGKNPDFPTDPSKDPLDEDRTFVYGDQGQQITRHSFVEQVGETKYYTDITDGYHIQKYLTDGTIVCADYTVTGSGNVAYTEDFSGTRSGCASSASAATPVMTLVDHTQKLHPRGNAESQFRAYVLTWQVDNNSSVAPNTFASAANRVNYCAGAGSGTANTGLVCEADTPASEGVLRPHVSRCAVAYYQTGQVEHPVACTRSTYDNYGAKTQSFKPNANIGDPANDPNGLMKPYTYWYYADSDKDASSTVHAGGWLRAAADPTASTTNPTSNFAAFGYDAAGNVVRTWDRNATTEAQAPVTDYPGVNANTPPTSRFTETSYAQRTTNPWGCTTTADLTPWTTKSWRYRLQTIDPLGNVTGVGTDKNGNALNSWRPAQLTGSPSGSGACKYSSFATPGGSVSTVRAYSGRDELTSQTLPAGATYDPDNGPTPSTTTYSYDGFGNQNVQINPRGQATPNSTTGGRFRVHRIYDAVNRLVEVRTSRTDDGNQQPASCPATGDGVFATGIVWCSTKTEYSGIDDVIATTAGTGARTRFRFDAVHYKTDQYVPRETATELHTQFRYNANGSGTVECSPREFDTTEPADSACADSVSSPSYATATEYDHAERPIRTIRHRANATSDALCTSFTYDANGNKKSSTDPRGNVPTGNACPANPTNGSYTTSYSYDVLDRKTRQTNPRSATATTETGYDANGNLTRVTPPANPSSPNRSRATLYSYDANNRRVDTIKAYEPAVNPDSDVAAHPEKVRGDAALQVNVHTRSVYDADGNVVARFDPRAFDDGTIDDTDNPDERFKVVTAYDANGRSISQAVPRYDGASHSNIGSDATQDAECPDDSGTHPSDVGVCVTNTYYDADSNVTKVDLPTKTGAKPNRYLIYRYTEDGLRATIDAPDPSNDGARLDGNAAAVRPFAMHYKYDGAGRVTDTLNADMRFTPGDIVHTVDQHTDYTLDGLVKTTSVLSGWTTTPPSYANITHVTTYGYDNNGQQTSVVQWTDAALTVALSKTTDSYFADGLVHDHVTGAQDTTGYVRANTRYTYDAAGNQATVSSPSATYQTDNHGQAEDSTAVAYASGDTIPAGFTVGDGVPASYAYTADNLLSSVSKPMSRSGSAITYRTTKYCYDDTSRKVHQATDTSSYDCETSPIPNNETVMSFEYYPNDQMHVQTSRKRSETITTNYDLAGNKTEVTDAARNAAQTSTVNRFDYYLDNLLRCSAENDTTCGTGSTNRATRYAYDGSGGVVRRVNIVGNQTKSSTLVYGDAGLPASQAADLAGGTQWEYSYDKTGRQTQVKLPNADRVCDYYDDPESTLTARAVVTTTCAGTSGGNDSAVTISDYQYDYDQLNRVTLQELKTGAASGSGGAAITKKYSYSYDEAGRVNAFDPDASTVGTDVMNVIWDHDGNRLGYGTSVSYPSQNTQPVNCVGSSTVSCFKYNSDDTIKSATAGTSTYYGHVYNPAGTLKEDHTTSYCYDGFDRLQGTKTGQGQQTTACDKDDATTFNSYDGLDRQTTTKTGGVTTSLYYDGASQDVNEENRNGNQNNLPTQILFVRDGNGTPLIASDGSTTTNNEHLVDDGNGNISTVLNNTNQRAVGCTARFDAFGSPQQPQSGDARQHTCSSGTTNSDMFYKAARRDDGTGTYQFGARTYDPTRSAFLSPDSYRDAQPAADASVGTDPLTQNTYTYVNGDPVNLVDPSGHGSDYQMQGAKAYAAKESCGSKKGSCKAMVKRLNDAAQNDAVMLMTKRLRELWVDAYKRFNGDCMPGGGNYNRCLDEFIRRAGIVLGGITGGEGLDPRDVQFERLLPTMPIEKVGGWKQEYLDSTTGQVRHFVAFLYAGYFQPGFGRAAVYGHERPGNDGASDADIRLGLVAVNLGRALRAHVLSADALFSRLPGLLGDPGNDGSLRSPEVLEDPVPPQYRPVQDHA
jgi:RHS repeat-associated protein